jgi:hypothetical protein
MAIINTSQRTLVEIVKSTITMEEELRMMHKNIKRYHQANLDNDELDNEDEEDHHKTKRKDTKVQFDTIRRGVYC